MTIATDDRKAGPFTGNGVTTAFPFTFYVLDTADIVVTVADTNGNETTLALTTDYTVTLNTDRNATPGGTVTLNAALTSGYSLVILTDVDITQTLDVTNMGGFYPSLFTKAFDKLTVICQQLNERLTRSLTMAATAASDVDTTLPAPVAGRVIAWSADAKGLVNVDTSNGTADAVNQALQAYQTSNDDALALKANTTDVNTALALKANTTDVNTALALKADISSTKKGGLTQSIAGNALLLSYASRLLCFRNTALTSGTSMEVTPVGAMGLTIPSGATLGGNSGVPMDVIVLGLYNAGIPCIGVVNANGGLVLDESGLISTTAISATSTSASTIYTTSAVTDSPYVILARLAVTLPTAGAWSVLPTVIPTDLVSVGLLMKRVLYPAVATTSGTSIGFQIPSWAQRATVQLNGVSTNGTSPLLVKLGVGGVAQSSTYVSYTFQFNNSSLNSTTGFHAGYRASAAATNDGPICITKSSSTVWTAQGFIASGNAGSVGGSCTLTGVADSLFLTTINGTDTFDAGSVSLLIEG